MSALKDIGALPPSPAPNVPLPAEQAQLDMLAAATDACRERLRPEFGRRQAGFHHDRDYVDTMEWDELLLFAAFDVIKQCKGSGIPPADLVNLASKHWPLSSNRALGWISFFFRYAEDAYSTANMIALRDAVKAREKAARVATAKAAAEARHSKTDGSRDMRATALNEWESGSYPTKGQCAETLAKKGFMSFRVARDHLKGAPDPANWPARTKRSRSSRSST